MRSIYFALLFAILALAYSSRAKATDAFVVRAERSTTAGDEQVVLAFEDDHATYLVTSNFLFGPKPIVQLGQFVAPIGDKLRVDQEELRRILVRLKELPQKPLESGPQNFRFYIDSSELDPESPFGKIVAELLIRIRNYSEWKEKKAITVTQDKVAKLHCEKSESTEICDIPGFGTAYLSQSGESGSQK